MPEEKDDYRRPLSDTLFQIIDPLRDMQEHHLEEMHRKITLLERERDHFCEQVRQLDLALEAAKAEPPAPALVALLGPVPQCPTCGAGEPWRSRTCCPLGTLVGQVEGRLVADILMEKDA